MPTSPAVLAASVLAATLLVSSARADLPPPDGRKFVSYGFKVDGLAAFPDRVLLAFPWSLSGGRPSEEHLRVEDGKVVSVGRRSGAPKLYAMKRADYEEWLASYKPPSDNYEDPALRALFTSPKARECDAAPTMVHEISDDDPRDKVIEAIRAVSIDDARCDLEAAADPASGGVDAAKKTKAGGCAGCQASAASGSTAGALAGLATMLLLGRRRRRLQP